MIDKSTEQKIAELERLVEQVKDLESKEEAKNSLVGYAKFQMENYLSPPHIKLLASKLEAVERGDIRRLAIFMPPRHGKSILTSEFFPAWYMGRNPDKYIICSTYAQDLADDFGRKVRNQLQDKRYTDIFPDAELSTDSSSMRRFNTTKGGVYYAVGAGSAITGRGAHLLLIDDPIKGREEADSAAMRKNLLDWYRATAYTRLMPNGSVILIQTRWHEDDLAGWILKETGHEGWDVIEFPAILNERAAGMLDLEEGDPLWKESYPIERLEEIKKTIGTREWSSLYAQKPSVEEGNIIKRWWWKTWTREQPPEMDYILQSWDTAYTVTETSDYSACTTWGVFSGEGGYNLFLIDSFREKLTFPELKNQAVHLYNEHQPDLVLVEAKASGWSLVQELMRTGIPITPFNPKKMDKLARVHSVAPLFEGGRIWAPDTDESADVMNQFAMFPNTKHDDLVDSTTQALLRLRKGWMVSHPQDVPMEEATGPKGSYW
jgi:predicted phage terminase large subunit-like protein